MNINANTSYKAARQELNDTFKNYGYEIIGEDSPRVAVLSSVTAKNGLKWVSENIEKTVTWLNEQTSATKNVINMRIRGLRVVFTIRKLSAAEMKANEIMKHFGFAK